MPRDLFKLRAAGGVPSRAAFNADFIPLFDLDGERYHFIEGDEEQLDVLAGKERAGRRYFEHLSEEELDEALDSADEAIASIEAGEYDAVLDMLLVAERREYGPRTTVLEAINRRNKEIVEKQNVDGSRRGERLDPDDIVTA